MQGQKHVRQILLGLVVGSLATVVVACGDDRSPTQIETTSAPQSAISQTTPEPQVSESPTSSNVEKTAKVYWLKDQGTTIDLAPTPVEAEDSDKTTAALTDAFTRLLAGPSDASVATAIPKGTTLRSVTQQADGIHVDLSQEFTSGGGSSSMKQRVRQVIYTATSLDPQAPVWISVEGEPVEVLGGEGLVIDQPSTRQAFEADFSTEGSN